MKPFLLFSGDKFYPSGGWKDFKGDFDTWAEARDAVPTNCDWWHVIDTKTAKDKNDIFAGQP